MLKITDRAKEVFTQACQHARKIGKWADQPNGNRGLKSMLRYLSGWGKNPGESKLVRTTLCYDMSPLSFGFTISHWSEEKQEWVDRLYGGLLFHGEFDGYGSGSGPTFAVCVSPCDGWSIHT